MKKFYLLVLLLFVLKNLDAQSTYVTLGYDEYWMLDRQEILSGKFLAGVHTSHKPYLREMFMDSLGMETKDDRDNRNLAYLINDNSEFEHAALTNSKRAILKHFYKTKADLFSTQNNDFMLRINPVL